jgi:hypothetical protein
MQEQHGVERVFNYCRGITLNPATVILESLRSNSPSIVKLPTTYPDTTICTIQKTIRQCLHPWRSTASMVQPLPACCSKNVPPKSQKLPHIYVTICKVGFKVGFNPAKKRKNEHPRLPIFHLHSPLHKKIDSDFFLFRLVFNPNIDNQKEDS